MASSRSPDRIEAERWFLANGLPAVLRPGALVRSVWARSAPGLAAYAWVTLSSVLVVALTGKHTIDINGTPTRTEWFVLAVLLLVLPVAALVGWAVSRLRTVSAAGAASTAAVLVIVASGFYGGMTARDGVNLIIELLVVAIVLLCTATGIGSILSFAAQVTMSNLASVGSLFVRALPVVLLTVLVFFNTYVWVMASTLSRARLWLALLFLFAVAAVFLVSSTLERVRPILRPDAKEPEDARRLAGTPFADMPDRPRRVRLSRPERLNVVFVLVLTQIVQVLTVAIVTALIFFVLGLIVLSPELLAAWTRNGSPHGELLGMTFPVPQALIQTSMFLTALTFMYLSARAVSDAEQRTRFLDPLLDDLRLTLVARDRYRTHTAES
ncbi:MULTISPECIES: hypothetical protein [unclassified Mycolicibacterium]|uniref:hypothetical protein n=1 Tax=unclassified Mycolicibacterium TaxID=2636767 RepID=UPI001309340A|nr:MULTISPECIES: hypothetical protein [unclassified Mycolicibacterium]MUL82485.1 hypothetical protein [Mycolicibacterium sp. CBMA 329]MUL91383.1 hypothetical protein [Mycolicibacterium sp. CBMA 331]MUM01506.1 hypothetical protein [Mycolicibacterium sp. CBMA 334]MUM27433.1 hypothetical protein [Mycolicibacterium sp. CBMA 295]MUM41807.1 hypothetical protein [Mycolicibacterium sp. CBMA 247]